MFIFEVISVEDAKDNLLKVVGGIVFLGVCVALITALMGAKK